MIATELRPVQVRVPGSTSNLGAGFDTLGLALNRYVTATYRPGANPLELARGGTLAGLTSRPEEDVLVRSFRARLEEHGVGDAGGELTCESEVPLARGLGSSAAAVVAGLTLADATVGAADTASRGSPGPAGSPGVTPWTPRAAALAWAEAWEGHPDNAAPSLYGGLVAVARDAEGRARALELPLAEEVGFAFAAPGLELTTSHARTALPAAVAHPVAVRALGRVAALVRGMATADPELIRLGFTDELHVPHRLPLIPGGEAALAAAIEAGAWAATISGSGTGLIAACRPDEAGAVAAAMADAFLSVTGSGEGAVAFSVLPDRAGARVLEGAA